MADLSRIIAGIPLVGHLIDLRLIEPSDALFVYGLRTTSALAEHLNPVTGSADDQRRWIEDYKKREEAGREFYFVVQKKSGTPCGLVRLYNVERPEFTWGSILMHPERPRKAAVEATLLSLGFGFDALGCELAKLDVRRANTHAIAFYRRFGMVQTQEDDTDLYFAMDKPTFEACRPKHLGSIRNA